MNVRCLTFVGLLAAVTASTACGAATTSTAEPRASADVGTRWLVNDWMTVHEIRLAPGASTPTHEGNPRWVYAMTAYTLRYEGDGRPRERSFRPGDLHAHLDAGPHAVRNVGGTDAHFLVFSRLPAPLPSDPPADDVGDVAATGPDAARVLLDTADVRILEVSLEPGASVPPHGGRHRIIAPLGRYTLRYTPPEGEPFERTYVGLRDVHWHEPGVHALSNVGDTPARFLVVAPRR